MLFFLFIHTKQNWFWLVLYKTIVPKKLENNMFWISIKTEGSSWLGDVPRRPSYGVYISPFIRFTRVGSHVVDFNTRNIWLTTKLSNKVIGIIS